MATRNAVSACSLRSFLLSLVSFNGSSTFSKALKTGSRLNDWKTNPICRVSIVNTEVFCALSRGLKMGIKKQHRKSLNDAKGT